MISMLDRSLKRLSKRAKRGMRGYPIGTVAFYGPDNTRATKVAMGIRFDQDSEPLMRNMTVETGDARESPAVAAALLSFFDEFGVKSVAMADGLLGCPHQEGIDYEGQYCPVCTYWIGRDRFTGRKVRSG
jgi:hypothetical protein